MRIEKIEIENFRGFKGKHEVSFHPNLNVFVGVNGAGKSSVLDLIGMFMNTVLKHFYKSQKQLNLSDSDVNFDASRTNNVFKFNKGIDLKLLVEIDKLCTLSHKIGEEEFDLMIKERQKLWKHNFVNFNSPLLRYFHSKIDLLEEQMLPDFNYLPPQYLAYKSSFDSLSNFKSFVSWFIEEENEENREKIYTKNLNFESYQLSVVRSALSKFFAQFQNDKYENLRVENQKEIKYEIKGLCIDKNGQKNNLNQLSSGQQTVLLMVADIASRISIATPNFDHFKDKDPLQATGIVLIDEIETHLHPEWQREVIPALTATFPNIQFFITTHSPQVLGSVDNQSVIIIENFEFKKAPHTKGRDSNSILTDVLGSTIRDIKYEKAFEELYDLIDNPDTVEEAKAKLRQMMTELGSDDSEIERAKMHFEFLTEKPV
jgi:predicted ATP-binding protein involved in virulence